MYSEHIEKFLDFLHDAQTDYNIFSADEREADIKTQDILHALEFDDDITYHEKAKLSKELTNIRKNRRVAKSMRENLQPVVQWVSENQGTIKKLEKLLGDVRRVEKRHETCFYTPRTDIVEKTIKERKND